MNKDTLERLVEQGLLDPDFLALPVAPVHIGTIDSAVSPPVPDTTATPQVTWHAPVVPTRPAPQTINLDPAEIAYYQNCPYHWLYSGHSHGWYHYAKEDNDALEALYNSGTNGSLQINNKTYTFNFEHMTQSSSTNNLRNILRVTDLKHIALRGVAGVLLDKKTIM